MKKITNIFLAIVFLAGLAACSTEAPFSKETEKGEGRLLTSALSVELKTDERLVRATNVPDVNDFTVDFLNAEDLTKEVPSYKYGEMPEVVTLPVGDYVVKAYYGGEYPDGKNAGFDCPYYLGQSERFSIEKDKIRDNIGTIECRLSNVKVSILFDENLKEVMGKDAKVTVNVGESGSLDFYPQTEESGFFAYTDGSTTLSAVFDGEIDGDYTNESKSYNDVKPGNHYRITFKLHVVDPNEPGDINPGEPGNEIKVDANIQLEDLTGNGGSDVGTPGDDDIYMDDDRYPSEGGDEPDPGPGPDEPEVNGPKVNPEGDITLEDWNENPEACVLNVHSNTGITAFDVEIKSDSLTPEELKEVGLASNIDLITGLDPDGNDLSGGLSGLGFPIKEQISGKNDVTFNITGFMPMLKLLGAGEHIFVLTVSDSEGTNTIELKIRITD